jgi:ABC-type antimicrobial peptide transport system permease subunit
VLFLAYNNWLAKMSRKRALVLFGVGVAFIVLALAILLAGNQQVASSTPQPKGGVYLHFPSDYQDGAQTKAYLIDSQLYYGVYNESFSRLGATGDYSINKGDPCIIINGTLRNDYDKDYYFAITANVYNSDGDKIEPVLTINSPNPGFAST